MGYYKDRQKTQDLQNNTDYSEKAAILHEPLLFIASIYSTIREIYFRTIF